jgi:hypothetical protein
MIRVGRLLKDGASRLSSDVMTKEILAEKMAAENDKLERLIGSRVELPASTESLEILRGMVRTAKLAKGK